MLSWKISTCNAAFFLVQDVRVSRCKTFLFAKLDFIIEKLMFFSQTSSFRSIYMIDIVPCVRELMCVCVMCVCNPRTIQFAYDKFI